eukprot:CAMPEP_0175901136 /NCGR_PEP_ID=MMETSP0108-20121206/2707_1 /TAXON_ID=195067 ORGANISM="Goniomonas pacifica, Strain CCMP1869" /NCGR_SAMPLE_ID=MMETSP0108 /ASSEMBLY_ACC=CAM_ASM_000204 /LENGTH=35 /DNA_ID= /DNA_START= /DNA_END= /DNA_ORIENTATION=
MARDVDPRPAATSATAVSSASCPAKALRVAAAATS